MKIIQPELLLHKLYTQMPEKKCLVNLTRIPVNYALTIFSR